MDTILITGANRGLGLEFVRQYAQEGARILACCRHPQQAEELQTLQKQYSNIRIYALDVAQPGSIEALSQEITDPIDILLNNAGMLEKEDGIDSISMESLKQTFMVNSVAPLKMAQAFAKHVAKSQRKLIANISSSMGSISDNTSGGYYSYRSSKAALNMLMKSAGFDLAPLGIRVLLLHPGWVKTRMGGSEATTEPADSIRGMRKIIRNYQPAPGEVLFLRYNGEVVPW